MSTEPETTPAPAAKPRTYPLTFRIDHHVEPITLEEAKAEDRGVTDAILIASLVYPASGPVACDIQFLSVDGRTRGPVPGAEIFRIWAHMATKLADNEGLDVGKRELCRSVSQILARAIDDAVHGPAT